MFAAAFASSAALNTSRMDERRVDRASAHLVIGDHAMLRGQAEDGEDLARLILQHVAELDRTSGHIVWQCPVCGDLGLIQGWEGTLWNRHGGGARAAVIDTPPTTSH